MQNRNNTINNDYGTGSGPGYRSGLAYILIGGGIGAALALLFAPKAGRQLRGDIADATRRGYDAAAEKAKDLNEKSGEIASSVKQKAAAVYEYAARKVASADTASEIVDQAASGADDRVNETNTAWKTDQGFNKGF